jgi:hypothetical protein
MKRYVVTLRHDNGTVDHEVTASSEEAAIRMVLESERAPESAVACVLPQSVCAILREALWQDERSG